VRGRDHGLFILMCNSSIFLKWLIKSIKTVGQDSRILSRFLTCISRKQSRHYNTDTKTIKTRNWLADPLKAIYLPTDVQMKICKIIFHDDQGRQVKIREENSQTFGNARIANNSGAITRILHLTFVNGQRISWVGRGDSLPSHSGAQNRMQVFVYSARYCCPTLTKIGMC
jgi:hypothetical protein